MAEDESVTTIIEGAYVITEIIKAAGDDPHVKEAASNLGQTAVTLTKTINDALLPLAAINFAFDKARAYFSGGFQQDIAGKTANIPPENIVEPKASVAGPMLQGLAFTHEEPNLREMYLSLLATAMDSRVAADAHPAFVEIIKQLDSRDARLIRGVLQSSSAIPIVEIRGRWLKDPERGYKMQLRHLLNLTDTTTGRPVEDARVPAMVDNWIRLRLVEVTYDTFLTAPEHYAWVEQRPEFIRLSEQLNSEELKVEFQKGILQRTGFGVQFAKAIGLLSATLSPRN